MYQYFKVLLCSAKTWSALSPHICVLFFRRKPSYKPSMPPERTDCADILNVHAAVFTVPVTENNSGKLCPLL